MADIGVPELLIILAILLLLFGPSRLSGLGRSLGQNIREFRSGVRDEQNNPVPAASEQPSVQVLTSDVPVNEVSHSS